MTKYFVSLVVMAVFFSGCGKKQETLAVVGSTVLTAEEYIERVENAPPSYRKYLASPKGQKQFMDLVIREKVVIAEARKAGTHRTEEFKETLASFEEEINKRLSDFKENLLMELFLRELNENELRLTDAEIKEYYEKNRDDFKNPIEMSISHILLPDEKSANDIYSKLKAGESFEKLASTHSTDPTSAHRGGSLGSVRKGELSPELENAALPLRIGTHSGVVKSDFGYHIIKKTGENRLPEISFEDSQELIRRILMKNKFDAWVKGALERNRVEIREDVLSRITEEYLEQ